MMMISKRLIGFLIYWFQENPIYNINRRDCQDCGCWREWVSDCEELVWYSKKREDENHPPILVVPSF